METYTITLGDVGENHVGMKKIGKLSDSGFTIKQLEDIGISYKNSKVVEYYYLHNIIEEDVDEALVIVIKRGVDNADKLMEEQRLLEKDTKALMRGRVVNKRARYNLCFDEVGCEPDYEKGIGRVVSFNEVPLLKELMNRLDYAEDLVAEGNYYYDINKCGIGYHGDSERRKVIGIRLGATMPLCYQWYKNCERVGPRYKINLDHGDIYYMSDKAVGNDWKKRSKYTLRHAAGCNKYIQ